MKNSYTTHRAKVQVIFALSALFHCSQAYSQKRDSLVYGEIEMIKILKKTHQNTKKENISTTFSDLLNHDAGKFLNSVPEISGIKKAGNFATDPVLRGFKYEQLNIIIDGAANAINACPSRMDPGIAQVNMNIVREAEIYKGPYHFRYGAALGGTINFVTQPPVFRDTTAINGRFSTAYESNGSIHRNEVFTQMSSKKIVWDLFGSYQKGGRYKDGNGNEVRSAFLRYNFGTKTSFKWNEMNTSTLQLNTNQGRNVEFAALKMDLLYDKTWMLQLKHLTEFHHSALQYFDFNSYFTSVNHSMGTENRSMVSDVKSSTYGARGELKFRWKRNFLFSGLDYKREQAENTGMVMSSMMMPRDGSSWQNSEIQQWGWFNEYQYRWNATKLTASFRLDHNTAEAKELSQLFRTLYGDAKAAQTNFSASVGVAHEFSKNSQVALWVGRAQRSGSLTERYINLFAVGTDAYEILGNPKIKPETNTQSDLIYTYTGKNIYFQTTVFYAYLQDYISGVIRPDIKPYSMQSPGVRQIQNLAKAMKSGAEARLNWQFLPQTRTELALAYTYAKDLDTHQPLPEIAPLRFQWKLETNISLFLVGLNYHYSAKQNRINTNFGEFVTPEFSVFDWYARYTVFKNAQLTFEMNNIFNRAYAEHLTRTLSDANNQRIMERGRNFSFGFGYSF